MWPCRAVVMGERGNRTLRSLAMAAGEWRARRQTSFTWQTCESGRKSQTTSSGPEWHISSKPPYIIKRRTPLEERSWHGLDPLDWNCQQHLTWFSMGSLSKWCLTSSLIGRWGTVSSVKDVLSKFRALGSILASQENIAYHQEPAPLCSE